MERRFHNWYSERNNQQSQLNQVKAQVKSFFPSHQSFEPNVLFVVTWDGVANNYQHNVVRFKIQHYELMNEWIDRWMGWCAGGWTNDLMNK